MTVSAAGGAQPAGRVPRAASATDDDPRGLGEVLAAAARHLASGRGAEAEAACRAVLARRPGQPTALHVLGIAAYQSGDRSRALELISAAVAADPADPTFHDGLGIVHAAGGDLTAATAAHRRAIRLRPDFAGAHHNLGNVLGRRGEHAAAVRAYRRALAIDPDLVPARINLGVALLAAGDLAGAAAAQREALARAPDLAEAHNNLAAALLALDRPDEAIDSLERAVAIRSDLPAAHQNLGAQHRRRGDLDAAVESFRRVVDLRPEVSALHLNLALTLLQTSRFEEGWREYEWRWAQDGAPAKRPGCNQPLWDGSPLAGRRILLVDEQGLGDTLHFIRYAPLVTARGGIVFAECARPLARLLATCPGVDRVVVEGEAPPEFDLQIPLLSLPRIFATDLGTVPAQVPYLRAPVGERPDLDEALGGPREGPRGAGPLRVGLVWAGSPDNASDHRRSCPLERLAPLLAVPGARLYSLQFGPRAADLARLPRTRRRAITDLGPLLGDFADTAALVERLDLVVTVDTSMAHLAGALGRPVWSLLAAAADWRWLTGRADTPWYPTMRLFRQPVAGDWESVVAEVAAALAAEVRKRGPAKAVSPRAGSAEREAAGSRPSSRGRAPVSPPPSRIRRARSAAPAAPRRRRG